MKNLDFALKVLKLVQVPVDFTIYGPREDKSYFHLCQKLVTVLPRNINVIWKDIVPPHKVISTLSTYDLFFLPTRGENYGHVIAESLLAGTPLLISDKTPWRNLEQKGVGCDLDLKQPQCFANYIEKCAVISHDEYILWKNRVRAFADVHLSVERSVEANRSLFIAVSRCLH